MTGELIFTTSQAAVYLEVSLATVRRWTDSGYLSCYRTPSRHRRFSRDQLDRCIAANRLMHDRSRADPLDEATGQGRR